MAIKWATSVATQKQYTNTPISYTNRSISYTNTPISNTNMPMHRNNNYGLQCNGITETLNNNMHYAAQHVYSYSYTASHDSAHF